MKWINQWAHIVNYTYEHPLASLSKIMSYFADNEQLLLGPKFLNGISNLLCVFVFSVCVYLNCDNDIVLNRLTNKLMT